MVLGGVGQDRKLRRLTPEERWCFVAGVLAVAHDAPTRGLLLIGEGIPAEPGDIAETAGVDAAVAEATLEKLRRLRVIAVDPEHECERVVNWAKYNPDPAPSNTRDAWRERKQKQRRRAREGTYKPDPGLLAVATEHFPDEDGTTIENAGRLLRGRGVDPTPDAIRKHLAEAREGLARMKAEDERARKVGAR